MMNDETWVIVNIDVSRQCSQISIARVDRIRLIGEELWCKLSASGHIKSYD